MSLGVIAGFAVAYPANAWMVVRRLKHVLMTGRSAAPATKHATASHESHREHEPGHSPQAGSSSEHAAHSPHHAMMTDATRPQLAAVGGVSALALAVGLIAPANWVNLRLSARQVGGAMMPPGMIIDPADDDASLHADHEYTLLLQEWLLREGLTYPAMPMDGAQPNYFTINGRAFPSTDTIPMRVGETLKVRFVGSNNGFIHPMHIHGGPFQVVAVDGQTLQPSARYFADTINVGPGQRFDVIWQARNPGKWLIHCHIGHHTTNNNVEMNGGAD
jgi:hypothetical protein